MDATVFYAWQDDRQSKTCRYLIRDAARAACQRVSDDLSNDFRVTLDEATEGAAGMCDIPNTILEKITECDVFLCDLTFVGEYQGRKKRKMVSSPNVQFELGYAARARGFGCVVGVMNTAHGVVEDQMFDIKRRWAIPYESRDDAEKAEREKIQASLSIEIEKALLAILEKELPVKGQAVEERFAEERRSFEARVRDGQFWGLFL